MSGGDDVPEGAQSDKGTLSMTRLAVDEALAGTPNLLKAIKADSANMQAMVAMLIPSAVGGLTLKPVKDSLQQVTTAVHAPDCARATAS